MLLKPPKLPPLETSDSKSQDFSLFNARKHTMGSLTRAHFHSRRLFSLSTPIRCTPRGHATRRFLEDFFEKIASCGVPGKNLRRVWSKEKRSLKGSSKLKDCGKLALLQTQNEKIINLTQQRLQRDFFLFLYRDSKVTKKGLKRHFDPQMA